MTDPIDTRRRRLLATTSTLAGISLLNLGASSTALARSGPAQPATTAPAPGVRLYGPRGRIQCDSNPYFFRVPGCGRGGRNRGWRD